ncbi:hypothetical protein K3495_g3006 [Podosphaera aphanis]|nr:hypothetical protein K3495_g3006 [Podosphaera aphanis]
MKHWVYLQNSEPSETRLIFSVADLHALTLSQDPQVLRKARLETLASMLAIGLDEKRCAIFLQSEFGVVTELMWILSCTASIGYLSRMTQWKSKCGMMGSTTLEKLGSDAKVKLGLFSYPVLQAADILIHKATHVPVGADQAQHLEFSRECVTNFNSSFAPILVKPETILSPTRRIKSLADPKFKMSKSQGNLNSRILITDTLDEIRKKIARAVTDSENRVSWCPDTRPGVANLLSILSAFDTSERTPEQLANALNDLKLGELKDLLVETLEKNLRPIRDRYTEIVADQTYLKKVAENGLEKVNATGKTNMKLIKEAVGLS